VSASGSVLDPRDARYNPLDATRLRDQSFVAVVHGQGGDRTSRERIFAGFNTPLLPEILICTSVGAEGIDLHRHWRRVVHYDLAWNPALVEQRTGRIDRIGSKTFRERERVQCGPKPWLEIGIPFLAGTYDERMFAELRMRAQTFEVLTGGDFAANNPDEDQQDAEGRKANLTLHPLPPEMKEGLRTRLHVWSDV
jgi:superfamily II DNA/RNA helicase